MKSTEDFGVVVCCCKMDFFLAKACCAGVRHVYPTIPLTLFIDDEFDASRFARAYNVQLMYRRDVKNEYLRTTNSGWGLPKMTLFWESPYERFLYLDCDTIVWGDVLARYGGNRDWDLLIDAGDAQTRSWIAGVGTPQWVNKEYFNTDKMEQTYPAFPWRKYMDAYFCTGTFAGRRGALDLEEYKQVIATKRATPGLFPQGEMGFLNFMIFRAVEEGRLKVSRQPMELLCDYTNYQTLPARFGFDTAGPVVSGDDVKVLHFTDPKPLASSWAFHAPVTYFRKQAVRKLFRLPSLLAGLMLRLEELPWRARITYRRRFGSFHKFVKPLLFWRKRR